MVAPVLSPPLFSYDYYQDPYAVFAWLRENSPVHEFRFPVDDMRMWIVTRFEDVYALLGDPRITSDAPTWANEQFKESGMVFGYGTVLERILSVLDPPDHTRVRKLAMSTFTPRRIAGWDEPVRRIVEFELDQLAASERPDLMAYASGVPARVMGEILGIPLDRFNEILHAIERGLGTDKDHKAEATQAWQEIADYGRELIAEKRQAPSNDLISALIAARDGDDRLNEDELVALVALMVMVGLDTTRDLIGTATLSLLEHPDQRDLLMSRPDLVPSAVEEFLRYDGALTTALFRFTREDLVIRGVEIPAGSPVVLALQAANRDPERFPDPDRLDITRTGPRHLGLGHGLHNCLGAALARLEASIAIPAVFERFPKLELAVARNEVQFAETWLLRSITAFPVHLNGSTAE